MWPELDLFLTEYREGMEAQIDRLVDVMRLEMTGIYQTIENGAALEKWDKFRKLVRNPDVPFQRKYDQSRLLLAEACGKPEEPKDVQ